MELKTPTKKGIKTPRYRPPLPMLNESFSGFSVEEYDWPLFSGYYNGTAVIIDDPLEMSLLTNKGFFGKGSLSKGCPNLAKRKIPVNVVYESQWKRRKMWMQSLNVLLESKKISNKTSGDNVVDTIKGGNDDENNDSFLNDPIKTNEAKSNENRQNESSGISKDNMVSIENNKSNDKNNPLNNNSYKNEGKSVKTKEDETENIVDYENKKSNEVVDNKNDKSIPLEIGSCKTGKVQCLININDDKEESKNCSNESSYNSKIEINIEKCYDLKKMDIDNERKDSGEIEEGPSKRIENDSNENKKLSQETNNDSNQATEVVKGQEESSDIDKNQDVINISVKNTENKQNSKESEHIEYINRIMEKPTSSHNFDNKSNHYGKINLSNNKEKGLLSNNEVLVIPDIDGDLEQYFLNLKPSLEEENVKTAIEVLYLSLEEAFFLSYACNCLQVYDLTSNLLRIKDMWILFQDSQPDFIEKYVAYHYFRAKGWVVKSGTKFGGDFLLYKKGPLYFHASYIVIVEVIKNDTNSRNKTTWQKIVGMNRMAESANKEILICHVLWPDVEKEKFNNPGILKEFGVSETLLRRWQATHEKTP